MGSGAVNGERKRRSPPVDQGSASADQRRDHNGRRSPAQAFINVRGSRGENAAVVHRGAMKLQLALATGQTAGVRKRLRRVYRINRSAKGVTTKRASRSASETEG